MIGWLYARERAIINYNHNSNRMRPWSILLRVFINYPICQIIIIILMIQPTMFQWQYVTVVRLMNHITNITSLIIHIANSQLYKIIVQNYIVSIDTHGCATDVPIVIWEASRIRKKFELNRRRKKRIALDGLVLTMCFAGSKSNVVVETSGALAMPFKLDVIS